MQVTTLRISARAAGPGANGQPSFGWVVFDDGKGFYWGQRIERDTDGQWRHLGGYDFVGRRSTHQGHGSTQYRFASAKREAALIAALND